MAPLQTVAIAVAYTALVLLAGFGAFGGLTTLVFTAGFVGGLVLWMFIPRRCTWADIRGPFWVSLALFLVHRAEEKVFGFFDMLARVSGVSTPPVASLPVVALLVLSLGAWLLIPVLVKRGHPLGGFFAWTFFASMGLTELAHWLLFPFLQGPGFNSVPGMWSVLLLAPVAWWGMWRMAGSRAPSNLR